MMRRDLVTMGSIAAICGIAVAALLTASFGARSSGPPAALRSAKPTTEAAKTEVVAAPSARKQAEKKRKRRHRREARAKTLAPPPAPAAEAPVTTQTQRTSQPQQTQTVAAPAPAPPPAKPLSRPKQGGSGGEPSAGANFDDSG